MGICKLDAEGPAPLFLVPHLTSEAESSRADSQVVQHGRCCCSCGRRPGPQGQRGQNLVAGEVTLGRDTTHWPLSPCTGPHHLCCNAQFLFRCFCCLPVTTELIGSALDFNTAESWKVPTFVIHCRWSLLFKVRGSGAWREANETVMWELSLPHLGSWAELREEPRRCQFVYTAVQESHSNHAGYQHKYSVSLVHSPSFLLTYLIRKTPKSLQLCNQHRHKHWPRFWVTLSSIVGFRRGWTEIFRLTNRYSDSLWAGRSGDRIPVEARFSASVQTDPGAHPASYTIGTGSLSRAAGARC